MREHGINLGDNRFTGDSDLQLDNIQTYFKEQNDSRFVPRAVLAEVCPSNNNKNQVRGFYEDYTELVDDILDTIRTEAEACDALQGFQMVHSLGEASSGLGALLINIICD